MLILGLKHFCLYRWCFSKTNKKTLPEVTFKCLNVLEFTHMPPLPFRGDPKHLSLLCISLAARYFLPFINRPTGTAHSPFELVAWVVL